MFSSSSIWFYKFSYKSSSIISQENLLNLLIKDWLFIPFIYDQLNSFASKALSLINKTIASFTLKKNKLKKIFSQNLNYSNFLVFYIYQLFNFFLQVIFFSVINSDNKVKSTYSGSSKSSIKFSGSIFEGTAFWVGNSQKTDLVLLFKTLF